MEEKCLLTSRSSKSFFYQRKTKSKKAFAETRYKEGGTGGERRQITSDCGWQQKNLLLHTGKVQLLSPNNLTPFSQGVNQRSQSSR